MWILLWFINQRSHHWGAPSCWLMGTWYHAEGSVDHVISAIRSSTSGQTLLELTHPWFLDIEDVPQSFDFEYLFLTKNCTLNKIRIHNHIASSDPHQLTYILTCYLTFYLAFHLSIWHAFWHSIWDTFRSSIWHIHIIWGSIIFYLTFDPCWCLVGNEWENGMITTSDYGSFPHSLLSTSKYLASILTFYMNLYDILSGIPFDIYSYIYNSWHLSDILSDIFLDTLSDKCIDILTHVLTSYLTSYLSDTLFNILSDKRSNILCDILSNEGSDISFNTLSGFFFFWHLTSHLKSGLVFGPVETLSCQNPSQNRGESWCYKPSTSFDRYIYTYTYIYIYIPSGYLT